MMMDIQIIRSKDNPILKRKEIVFKVIFDESTPSRKSVVERLAATENSKVGLVYVDSLKTEFGKRESLGYAKIYETAERAKEIERPHIIERNTFTKAEEAKPGAS